MSGRWGLVLGGGGVLGGAWMVGALTALQDVHALDPRDAELIVGTSAGAVTAALLGAGVSVEELRNHQLGEPVASGPLAELDWDYDTATGGSLPMPPQRLAPSGVGFLTTTWAACGDFRRPRSWRRSCRRGEARWRVWAASSALWSRTGGPLTRACGWWPWISTQAARGLRVPGRPGRRPGRRGDGLLRHPRLVRAGDHRRRTVCRRRRLFGDERRPAGRFGPGRGVRPGPDGLVRDGPPTHWRARWNGDGASA